MGSKQGKGVGTKRGKRRGASGLAVVIMLVVMQLLVVGVVIANGREQDTTKNRIETLRAFYAAEGAMNMAIRESLTMVDDDGDGNVGTISDDSNLADDPNVGTGRAYVVKSVNGTVTTLVSRGRSGGARRQLTTDIE